MRLVWHVASGVALVLWLIFLPTTPNGQAQVETTPTAQPERTLRPPAGLRLFANWSANAMTDAAGATYWTATTENGFGTCLFRADTGGASSIIECRKAPDGGGESIVLVDRAGYGRWQQLTLSGDDHSKRALLDIPIPGWVR